MNYKALKFRFYPTADQQALLAQTFGCVRVVYNNILDRRSKMYYDSKESVNYPKACKMLTALKQEEGFSWLKEVSSVALQQSLQNQQNAFKNFFAKRASYPKFKNKHGKQSFTLVNSGFKFKDGNVYIAKSKEPLNIKWSRSLPSDPSTITISKDPSGRYFVSMLCEAKTKRVRPTKKTVGIDLGIKHLVICDDGRKFDNPKYTKKYAEKLAIAQRELSKKKKGSSNRAKAKLKVAKIHAKISDCRLDNLHKISRTLVSENQVICAESLDVKRMMNNKLMAKAIADSSWGELIRQINYKSQWAGRTFVQIDQFFPSSKRCNSCGHTMNKLPLDIRSWKCPSCHAEHDRDINAAKNIKAAGLAVLAFGDTVIPS